MAAEVRRIVTSHFYPLYIAAANGRTGIVERLLRVEGVDVNRGRPDNGATPLYMACQKNHEAVVKRLLAHDAIDVNRGELIDGYTPLYIACAKNHEAVVERLLAHGASVTRCFFSFPMCVTTALCCIPCCVIKTQHCCMVPAIMKSLCSRICTSSSTQNPSRKLDDGA